VKGLTMTPAPPSSQTLSYALEFVERRQPVAAKRLGLRLAPGISLAFLVSASFLIWASILVLMLG
jgi:hypothetical protein